MTTTYTASLRLSKPGIGDTNWGGVVNSGATDLTDVAIAGYISIAMSDADYTLTTANGSTDQSRYMTLNMTGSLSATRNVICPSVSKLYIVRNSTSQTINFKTSGYAGVSIVAGGSTIVICNGTTVVNAMTAFNGTFNGAIGTVTPNAGAFTTITATGLIYGAEQISAVSTGYDWATAGHWTSAAFQGKSYSFVSGASGWTFDGTSTSVFRLGFGAVSGTPTSYLNVNSNGNVSIGSTGSTYKLEVAGTIYSSSGGIRFPDNTTQTSAAVATVQASVKGSFSKLAASATGTSASISVSADELVLETSGNAYVTVRSVSLTINSAASGANGLDTGTLAASTWYYVYVINNGTTTAGLISASLSSPTLPSGYTYIARVGAIRTDSTANKYPLAFKQSGRRVQYALTSASNMTAYPTLASGTGGTWSVLTITAWAATSVSTFVPPTATVINLFGILTDQLTNSLYFAAAPNNVVTDVYQAPLHNVGNQYNQAKSLYASFVLESTNIYWASNGAGALIRCTGWEDNL